jgi:CMP-N-acetylneuraminic acid synthetase
MTHAPRVVAFVHAKGSSSRVPAKNLRQLGDRPLFCHAIARALAASRVEQVVIDSDSEAILELGAAHGARPLRRPAELASNAATGDDLALWQAQHADGAEIVLQVVPTAPFLEPRSIDRAVELLQDTAANSVVGVFSEALYCWEDGRPAYLRADGGIPNSFEMTPVTYETTGLYANRRAAVLRSGRRLDPRSCVALPLSRLEAIDINTADDFALAEIVWYGLRARPFPTSR